MTATFVSRLRRTVRTVDPRAIGLVGFLLLTLGVVSALGYEAWRSARAQRSSAERALSEYARFAALTYRQRVIARLYTTIVGVIRPIADSRNAAPAGELPDVTRLEQSATEAIRCRCGPALEPTLYFRVRYADREVSVSGAVPSPGELAMLAGLPDSIGPAIEKATDWDYATIYDVSGNGPRILIVALRRGPDKAPRAVYGFGVPASVFMDAMFRPPAANVSLLPLTPAERIPNDSLLSVVLREGGRTRFLATSQTFDATYSASIPFDGIAGITAIAVALNPILAPRVLIGGVPTSRLPLLVTLLVLSALLLTATILFAWRAMELARARSDFVSSVSHELRTPLAQVLLFGETLSLGRMSTRREVRRAADIIVGETRRLMQLVDNVLLLGRRDRGGTKKPTESVSLGPVVRDVITAFAPLASAAEVTMRVVRLEGCVVLADRAELRQVMLNLLDNAVKYGPRGQTVLVGLARVNAGNEGRARIWVEDEGPGIPEADRQRVWEPFVRLARDDTSEVAGSGIGLAVVHQIVARHGGTAWVESAPGGGACVVVEFPGAVAPSTVDVSLDVRRSARDQASR